MHNLFPITPLSLSDFLSSFSHLHSMRTRFIHIHTIEQFLLYISTFCTGLCGINQHFTPCFIRTMLLPNACFLAVFTAQSFFSVNTISMMVRPASSYNTLPYETKLHPLAQNSWIPSHKRSPRLSHTRLQVSFS